MGQGLTELVQAGNLIARYALKKVVVILEAELLRFADVEELGPRPKIVERLCASVVEALRDRATDAVNLGEVGDDLLVVGGEQEAAMGTSLEDLDDFGGDSVSNAVQLLRLGERGNRVGAVAKGCGGCERRTSSKSASGPKLGGRETSYSPLL